MELRKDKPRTFDVLIFYVYLLKRNKINRFYILKEDVLRRKKALKIFCQSIRPT